MAKINRINKTYKLNILPELINNSFVFNNKTRKLLDIERSPEFQKSLDKMIKSNK